MPPLNSSQPVPPRKPPMSKWPPNSSMTCCTCQRRASVLSSKPTRTVQAAGQRTRRRPAMDSAAAGLSTDKSKIEGLRAKLKRLVERGWLAEDGPGLFMVPRRDAQDASNPPA